jgi:tetratricopeptide (TPR) repeat protein
MAIKGSLNEAGLADVCQLLALGRKTGRLSVTDRARFGQIYFDNGRITFATMVNRRDRLGDVLIRDGAITADQLREAVDAQARDPDRRLGELLVERGFIDTDTLAASIRHQIEEAIYYLFTWKRGQFHFEVDQAPDPGEILISVNPETLLLEGARRVDEWGVIEKKIPSLDLIFDVDGDRLTDVDVDLTDAQRQLIRLLDGRRTVEEVVEASGDTEFDVAKGLYGLLQAGFIHRSGRRAPEPGDDAADAGDALNLGAAFYETAMLDDAEREFRRVLQAQPRTPVARHYLALIALQRGDTEGAARRLTQLLESAGPRIGAYLNLAYALRRQGEHDRALRVLGDARQLAPADPRIRLAEAATALAAGDPEAAEVALAAYRERAEDGRHPATYAYCRALAALCRDDAEEADAAVAEGLDADPSSAPLHLLAGTLAERRGDTAEAARSYQRAAEEDPTLAQAHRNLGDLARERGAGDEAIDHYRRAVEADPGLGDEVYTLLGDLHYRQRNRDLAVRCWQKALDLNPRNEVARSHLDVVADVST